MAAYVSAIYIFSKLIQMWRSMSEYSNPATRGFAVATYSIFLAHGMEQKSCGTGLIGSREFGIF